MTLALVVHGLERASRIWLDLVTREVLLSTVVFTTVLALTRLARGRRGPSLHHALWWLVLVRLLLPPGLASPWSAHLPLGARVAAARDALDLREEGVGLAASTSPGPSTWTWRSTLLLGYLSGLTLTGTLVLRRLRRVRR